MANTRKTLERIPEDKFDWKPDPKSFAMGMLASHIAEMIGWTAETCEQEGFDVDPAMKPFKATNRAELLKKLDESVARARVALEKVSDDKMMAEWKLTVGGQQVFSMPRIAVLRSMIMNHIIHHRAQLTVYYRLNGVPVPGLYGPSADEGQASATA